MTRTPPPSDGAAPGEIALASPSRPTLVVDDLGADTEIAGGAAIETGRGLELVGKAGEGGMGEVLVATDRDLDRTVAFKVMKAESAAVPSRAARFYAEARITAQLDHPGIVPIHGLARSDDGRLGYTMKLVRGRTLRAWLAERAPGSHEVAARLEVYLKLCDAVHYAHVQRVLHRDLKPENVMLGDHGEVYVMDWGLAALLDGEPPEAAGTVGFVPPEGPTLDVRSDLYALGVILRELVTRADGRTGAGAVPTVDLDGNRVARELGAIVAKATAPRREDRYASVAALAEDVRRHLAGAAVLAAPDDPVRAVVRWTGHHRVTVLVLLVGSVLLGVAGVGWSQVARWREATAAAESEQVLTALIGRTATQAAGIDARLVRYEGLAQAFGATALERWERGAMSRSPVFFAADFDDAARAPADLAPSPYYGVPVSVDQPVLMVSPADPPRLAAAGRLAGLGAVAREAMVGRIGIDEARARILTQGVSPAFVSVAFEDGVWLSYPGHGGFPAGYDARDRPWYAIARDARGPVWGAPYVDSAGLGLLLPCSVPLRGDGDRLVGVASVKLPLAAVIGDLLQVENGEGFLLDREGRVLIRENQATDAAAELVNTPEDRPLFDVPAVVDAVVAGRPGVLRIDGELLLWQAIPDLGWALVVRGDADGLRVPEAR